MPGNQSIRGLPLAPNTHTIYNVVSDAIPGTEFSQVLTSGTKQLLIRCREPFDIQFTFVTGESGTKYITIPKNATYKVQDVDLQGSTLFMQIAAVSKTVEIEEWS